MVWRGSTTDLSHQATRHSVNYLKRAVTPGVANTTRVSVFSVVGCGNEVATFGMTMNENNNPKSASFGIVMMAIVPIIVYVMTVLVLPLILRGFH